MTATKPVYRLAVFAPSSEDPTETSVLTPIAGAAHADPFRVATTKDLIAPATNLAKWSQDFSNAVWVAYFGKPAITGGKLAPDGSLTAQEFASRDAGGAGGGFSGIIQNGAVTMPNGGIGQFTVSVWARCTAGTLDIKLGLDDSYMVTVTIDTTWRRYSATFNRAAAGTNRVCQFLEGIVGNVPWQLWGAQVEAGAVATAYIPTTAATVTRPAFQPYLGMPSGRQGSLEYVTKRTTTGNLSLPLADFRTTPGGANAVRWVTAFLGDALGRTRFKGCKFLLERSLDGGGLFVPLMAGRVRNTGQSRAQWHQLDVKDFADDLNRPLFKGAPHPSITYAALSPLFPNGLVKPYGNCTLTPPVPATIGAAFATAPDTVVVNVTNAKVAETMITQQMLDSNSSSALRVVELTTVSDGSKHYYQWPRGDAALANDLISGGPTAHYGLKAFPIAMLPVGDVRREALPAVGTAVTVSIVQDAPPSEATPLLINDVPVVQYIADLLDGKFSCAPGSTTLRPLAERNTDPGNSWDTLLADASLGTMRDVITKLEEKANDYLEKVILQRYNLALVRDGRGRVDLVDLRRKPTLAGVVTLTDADLVSETEPSWDDSRDGAITAVQVEYYVDQQIPLSDLVASADTFPTLPSARVRATKSSIVQVNDLSTFKDIGEKVVTIAARGDRISSGDLLSAHFGRQRRALVEARLQAAALDFLRPIGSGIITAKATYRLASANAAQIAVGKYFIVQHTKLPDPATNQRGGARLMLCLSCDERDGALAVQWMDAGSGSVALSPAITAVASANAYSIDVTLAANAAGDPIELHVAVTDTTVGVRPADTAGEWLFAATTAAGTVHVANLPPGKRIWTRARSIGNAANVKLPSSWVYAPAPGYLDLAAGTAVDLSQPAPSFEPIAAASDVISPPTAAIDLVSEDDTQVVLATSGAVGAGGAGPLQYAWRTGAGAWSAYSAVHPNQTVLRAPKLTKQFQLKVKQADGQESAPVTYAVTGSYFAINPGSGEIDPTVPLHGTSHFIPRATDINGMILDPGVKENGGRPLMVVGTALDTNGYLQSRVTPTALVTGSRTARDVAHQVGRFFSETWEESVPTHWTLESGTNNTGLAVAGEGVGKNAAVFTGPQQWTYNGRLPFNPSKLYRVRTMLALTNGGTPLGTQSVGLSCYDANGAFLAVVWMTLNAYALTGFARQTFTGWAKGISGTQTTPANDPTAPSTLPANTAFIAPRVLFHAGNTDGLSQLYCYYIQIDEQDEDAAQRTYSGLTPTGDVKGLAFSSTGGSKNIVRGGKTGTCKHGDVVVFPTTANLPAVILLGGVDYQPESKWGTSSQVDSGVGATNPPTAGKAQYRDFQALNLTNSSFSVRARKRIKAAGSSTQTYDFAANSLVAAGQQTADVTLAAGPSSTGQYTVRYDVALAITCTGPGSATITAVVAIEIDNGSGSFFERASATHQLTSFAGDGGQTSSQTFTLNASATVTGTSGKIRLRLKSLSYSGVHALSDGATVHGHTATDTGRGIEYPVSSGDLFTSATPDTDDAQAIAYTIVEI